MDRAKVHSIVFLVQLGHQFLPSGCGLLKAFLRFVESGKFQDVRLQSVPRFRVRFVTGPVGSGEVQRLAAGGSFPELADAHFLGVHGVLGFGSSRDQVHWDAMLPRNECGRFPSPSFSAAQRMMQ